MPESRQRSLVPDEFGGNLPRHRHNLTREQVKQSQAARIINAAIELFASRGYAGTTVLDIVKRAGVSRKTFYELFDTKEAVIVAAYRAFDTFLRDAGLTASNNAILTTPEQLHGLVRALLTLLGTYPAGARMFFLEVLGAGDEVRRRRAAAITQFTDVLGLPLQHLRESLDPGLPPLDPILVRGLVGGVMEMIVDHLVHHEPGTIADLTEDVTHLILGVTAPSHAAPR
ncbi:TetR/AcrR family transcriptional regulator [Lolliginicoccus suaedae]|uniref:TetR/AcrR family transcriptional regulator n=1 Tax=Lolliginicoccus suaedae TaxID=2605429 RepID=UPI001658D318|nr:TetR/AcrR family transcriptional regulator [Lolliginicoccus suaedae]